MNNKLKIAFTIITYKRHLSLAKCLKSINRLSNELIDFQVILVSNDQHDMEVEMTARQQLSKYPLIFAIEPKRGIPYARNKSVEIAINTNIDGIFFIDDDEFIEDSTWGNKLLHAITNYPNSILTGPVIGKLPDGAPSWAIKSGAYSTFHRRSTGTKLKTAYTNNTYVPIQLLRILGTSFHAEFEFTGSSDHHYFMRAAVMGNNIYWISEMKVFEDVPLSRISVTWLVKRAFRSGLGDSVAKSLILNNNFKTILYATKGFAVRFFAGAASMIYGLLKIDLRYIVKGLQLFSSSLGTLAGLTKYRLNEYRKIHGK